MPRWRDARFRVRLRAQSASSGALSSRNVAARAALKDSNVIVEQGTHDEVFDNPQSNYTKDFLGHIF